MHIKGMILYGLFFSAALVVISVRECICLKRDSRASWISYSILVCLFFFVFLLKEDSLTFLRCTFTSFPLTIFFYIENNNNNNEVIYEYDSTVKLPKEARILIYVLP